MILHSRVRPKPTYYGNPEAVGCPPRHLLQFPQAAAERKVVMMTYESSLSLEERVASLFQPDTVLPAQYLDTVRRKTHMEPEKKLMLSVLEDAVACYQKYVSARDARATSLLQEAEQWILEESSDWLFSFDNICESLGLNPKYIRGGLLQWKETKLAKPLQAKIYRLPENKGGRKKRSVISQGSERRYRKTASR